MRIAPALFFLTTTLAMMPGTNVSAHSPAPSPLTLWYSKPANNAMNEALPIGNGNIGGLIFGCTANERIVLNEDSLWTGDDNPSGGYDNVHFGTYVVLGDLHLSLPGHDKGGDTGDVREWSFAWRTALYARLLDGTDAHRELQQLFSWRNTTLNLFGYHPPVQLDGTFGISAAITEMLLQSQAGEIAFLPALPPQWPAGSVKGLRARGGFAVDIDWQNSQLTGATIHSITGTVCRVRYGKKTVDEKLTPGGTVSLTASQF